MVIFPFVFGWSKAGLHKNIFCCGANLFQIIWLAVTNFLLLEVFFFFLNFFLFSFFLFLSFFFFNLWQVMVLD